MILVFINKTNLEKIEGELDYPQYSFKSPKDVAVDHSASKVVLVGNYPNLAKKYKGICPIEQVTVDELPIAEEESFGIYDTSGGFSLGEENQIAETDLDQPEEEDEEPES